MKRVLILIVIMISAGCGNRNYAWYKPDENIFRAKLDVTQCHTKAMEATIGAALFTESMVYNTTMTSKMNERGYHKIPRKPERENMLYFLHEPYLGCYKFERHYIAVDTLPDPNAN